MIGRAAESAVRPDQLAAFLAERHPETIETKEPYRVSLRQVQGAEVNGGAILYSVVLGSRTNEGQVALRRNQTEKSWIGGIPGQSVGGVIHYHFLLTNNAGAVFRHPVRTASRYSFRIVPVELAGLSLSDAANPSAGKQRVSLRLRSSASLSGSLVWRRLSLTAGPEERRVALAPAARRSPDAPSPISTFSCDLPELEPGEIGDFFFVISTDHGAVVTLPPGAPNQVYSIKRPSLAAYAFPSGQLRVTDLAVSGADHWVGTQHGGVWRTSRGEPRHWGLTRGLPSSTAQFVVADSRQGAAWVGTDQGVFAIEGEGELPVMIVGPHRPPPRSGSTETETAAWGYDAGPAALSPLDGTLLFQLRRPAEFEQTLAVAKFLEWRGGQLREWLPGGGIATLTSITFDDVEGCWLIGALVVKEDNVPQPALLFRIGERTELFEVPAFSVGAERAIARRVVAASRDPITHLPAVVVEYFLARDTLRRSHHGIMRLEPATGRWRFLAPELADVGTEVSSLVTDWPQQRILIGTFGRGILTVRGDRIESLASEGIPKEITALKAVVMADGVLVGTPEGAFELKGSAAKRIHMPAQDRLPADSLPMDSGPARAGRAEERMLLSSYREGLVELERTRDGPWRAGRRLRPGREVNEGLFGEAKYTPAGEIVAVVHSQGLLRVGNDSRPTLLGTNDGLKSGNILQVLARESGEVWVAHTPFPFGPNAGGVLQMLRENRVVRTVPLASRDVATISQWVEVPNRRTIFAATRAGVVEIANDGVATVLAGESVSAIARSGRAHDLGAAGTTFLRWDGTNFNPVIFQVNHVRWPVGRYFPGAPLDLGIDREGFWYVLFQGGRIAVLDAAGEYRGLLDPEDGVPSTARRLLVHRMSGEIFVGSNDGLVLLKPLRRPNAD